MSETAEVKRCPKCGKTKPLTEFYYDSWRGKHSGYCKVCKREMNKKYYSNNKKERSEAHKAYYGDNRDKRLKVHATRAQRLRYEVLSLLSGGTPVCAVCETEDLEVLVIDHIHGGGSKERAEIGQGTQLYMKILGLPLEEVKETYQSLCRNCNWKKRLRGK